MTFHVAEQFRSSESRSNNVIMISLLSSFHCRSHCGRRAIFKSENRPWIGIESSRFGIRFITSIYNSMNVLNIRERKMGSDPLKSEDNNENGTTKKTTTRYVVSRHRRVFMN